MVNSPSGFHSRQILYTANSEDSNRLPKIKAWIDANNAGDPLIPFSVALEERLSTMTPEDKKEAEKEAAPSALGKITHAGYSSLEVSISVVVHRCGLSSTYAIVN